MTIAIRMLRLAAEALPKCKTLKDAEQALGGEWDERHVKRDAKEAAVTWGLFDGYSGRPKPTLLSLSLGIYGDYAEAYEAGCKIKLSEVPG